MKRRKIAALLFLLFLGFFVTNAGVSTKVYAATPSLSQNSFTVSAKAGSGSGGAIFNPSGTPTVNVLSGQDWLNAWIIGTSAFGFETKENTSSSQRIGTFAINVNGTVLNVTVTQEGRKEAAPTPTPDAEGYLVFAGTTLQDGVPYKLDYRMDSFKLALASNRNLTVKVDGQVISMKKSPVTPNGIDYLYEYTMNLGQNLTKYDVEYRIEVTVDGQNVRGGNNHTYYLIHQRPPVVLEVKILGGSFYDSNPLRYVIRTNDDYTIYYRYREADFLGFYKTKSTKKHDVNVELNTENIVNGEYLAYESDLSAFRSSYIQESTVEMHVISKYSGKEVVLNVNEGMDKDQPTKPIPTPTPTATPTATPTPTPQDESLKGNVRAVYVNHIPSSSVTHINAGTSNILSVDLEGVNKDWVMVEVYSDTGNDSSALKSVNCVAEGKAFSGTKKIDLNLISQSIYESYYYNTYDNIIYPPFYYRNYYLIDKEAYDTLDFGRRSGYDEDFIMGFLEKKQYIKLFQVQFKNLFAY